MAEQTHTPMEQLDLFQRYIEVGNWAWKTVSEWKPLAVDTIGKQLVRAADSIGANLVEGDGRYAIGDSLHFLLSPVLRQEKLVTGFSVLYRGT